MPAWWKRASGSGEESKPILSGDTALDSLRYVVLDTELTLLDRRTNRLLSIGAIEMQGRSIHLGNQFYPVVNPSVPIPAENHSHPQTSPQDVRGGEQPVQVLDDLRQFIASAVLVGHCLDIDLKILKKEMANTGHKLSCVAIATARVHHWILRHGPYSEDLPVQLENRDLITLAKFYSLDVQGAHHALSDAFLTARVWQKMLYLLQAKRVRSLQKLLRIGAA
jgi:DNA polymerase-3 subunit epsilon